MLNEKVEEAILEYLGVERNEVFGLMFTSNEFKLRFDYRFNESGLQTYVPTSVSWENTSNLRGLLTGELKIFKKTFIPKLGQEYYVVNILSPSLFFRCINDGVLSDKQAIKYGLAFKTKQGAINKAKEILKLIEKGDE